MPFGENKCIKSAFRNELQLLTTSSVLMNHQCILNKVSVTHLNTLRQGYVLVDRMLPEAHRNLNLVFPLGADSILI